MTSAYIFVPVLQAAFSGEESAKVFKRIEVGMEKNAETFQIIENWLGQTPYLLGNQATFADISCYCELGQLVELGLSRFEKYPNIQKWIERMQQLPGYEQHAKGVLILTSRLKKAGIARL